MSDDGELTERVRAALSGRSVREIRMFGGLSFMVDDKMVVNVRGNGDLLVRVDPGDSDDLLRHDGVQRAEMGTGRSMGRGWLTVSEGVLRDDDAVRFWTGVALEFNARTTKP